LLDALANAWEQESGVALRPHLVGSGRALEMLADGSVSLVISHAPQAEAAHLARQPRWQYRKFMYNDFILVGPPADPAQARSARTIEDAMRRIAASEARFLSRGDHSGTHEREQTLWKLAGAVPQGNRLVIAGSGMGATLRIAAHTGAYTGRRGTAEHIRRHLEFEPR
jgi:tungstate transport system substrate-binding protein